MPMAREGGEHEREVPPLVRGGGGVSRRENFEFLALLCAFLCVWDQISVTIFFC